MTVTPYPGSEFPVITNHVIDFHPTSIDGDEYELHCTDCGAQDVMPTVEDTNDWADQHLCPWGICYCGLAASEHVDGMHLPRAVEPRTVTK